MLFSILPNDFVHTKTIEFQKNDELIPHILNNTYSGSIFNDNYTNNENFISTQMMILDYDNYPNEPQMPLHVALEKFAKYRCIIATTRNHLKEKVLGSGERKPAADRFRVILFLSRPIKSLEDFKETFKDLSQKFPGVDQACSDPARRLYKSSALVMSKNEGELIEPIRVLQQVSRGIPKKRVVLQPGQYGELSQKTRNFMARGSESHFNNNLYLAARDYFQQGYSQEQFIEQALKITGTLDHVDHGTIASAFSKPPLFEPRVRESNSAPAVEVWVRSWLRENQVEVSYKTNEVTYRGKTHPTDFIMARMILDAKYWAESNPTIEENGKEKKRPGFSDKNLEHAFNVWLKEQAEEVIDYYKEIVAFNKYEQSPVADWVEAVTGNRDPMDIAVMTHFVWQVKRKLNGLPVEWHMMPIVCGKTGGGKTRAIEKLLEPVEELAAAPQDLRVLEDPREARILGKFYVLFFDEMGRAERVDVNALKNKITSNTVTYRRLGTNIICTERNVATFIGASNSTVQDLIFDPTSARRFWQLDAAAKLNHEKINQIDYWRLWASVDEAAECPIKPYLDNLLKSQDKNLRAKSYIEQWVTENVEIKEDNWMTAREVYNKFKDWCDEQRIKISGMSLETFGRRLTEQHSFPKRRVGKGVQYAISICPIEDRPHLAAAPELQTKQ